VVGYLATGVSLSQSDLLVRHSHRENRIGRCDESKDLFSEL
jgi:hypothetical protein